VVSDYFTKSDTLFDWAEEYYTQIFPLDIDQKPEFQAVNEQDFLAEFSSINVSESVVEEEEMARIPLKINNLPASGSSQNEVLSNFFKSLLAKKG
jgi:hypothetical protein